MSVSFSAFKTGLQFMKKLTKQKEEIAVKVNNNEQTKNPSTTQENQGPKWGLA